MSDILPARTMSFNCVRAMKFGYKPSKIERLIMLRSDCTHMEFQFSTRYGGISFSSTLRDGVKGCRFKMIIYSHPEYWDAVYVPVTTEQERNMFIEATELADARYFRKYGFGEALEVYYNEHAAVNGCIYGPNHVKYDLSGAAFSYWTKFKIWKPHKTKMVCNRAVAEVVLAGEPKAMDTLYYLGDTSLPKRADHASMTPSETDAMFRNFFSSEGIISRTKGT